MARLCVGLTLLAAGSTAAMFSLLSGTPAELGVGLILVVVGTIVLMDALL